MASSCPKLASVSGILRQLQAVPVWNAAILMTQHRGMHLLHVLHSLFLSAYRTPLPNVITWRPYTGRRRVALPKVMMDLPKDMGKADRSPS